MLTRYITASMVVVLALTGAIAFFERCHPEQVQDLPQVSPDEPEQEIKSPPQKRAEPASHEERFPHSTQCVQRPDLLTSGLVRPWSPGKNLSVPRCPKRVFPNHKMKKLCAEVARTTILQSLAAPVNGGSVVVGLQNTQGDALGSDYSECIELRSANDCSAADPIKQVHTWRPISEALSFVLIDVGETKQSAEQAIEAANGWIDARPKSERIAVYRLGSEVTQVVGPTSDRARIRQQMQCGLPPRAGEGPNTRQALQAVHHDLRKTQRHDFAGIRAIAVATSASDPTPYQQQTDTNPVWMRVFHNRTQAVEMSKQLDMAIKAGAHSIGYCNVSPNTPLAVVSSAPVSYATAPKLHRFSHFTPQTRCDARDLSENRRVSPERISIDFTRDEQLTYEERVKTKALDDFSATVQLHKKGLKIPAKIHLRGNSTIRCERKSYTIDLDGSAPAYLTPNFVADEFIVISMCKDPGYINQITINRILTDLGVFELESKMVELVLNGQSRGMYLVLEKHQKALRSNRSRTRTVLRRRTDMDHPSNPDPRIRHSRLSDDDTLKAYHEILAVAKAYQGDELLRQLNARMDLRQYLTWVAVLSLFQSRDHIDEVWFISEETTLANGMPGDFFSIHAWDQDQLFRTCHHSQRLEIKDPYKLLHCTESIFDHSIFADPVVYRLYVDILSEVLAKITPKKVEQSLATTEKQLLSLLRQPEIRRASIELHENENSAPKFADVSNTIGRQRDDFQNNFVRRTNETQVRIQMYRATNPSQIPTTWASQTVKQP